MRWIGSFPLKRSLYIFFGASVLGAIATLVTGGEPGSLLGILIVIGAVVAALCIERRSLYLLFPMPALSYLLLAIGTGLIHDSGNGTSTTQLGLGFLQWIGNGFFAMCAATILVGVIFGARLLASRQLVSGSFPMSENRPSPARSNGSSPSARRDDFDGGGDSFNTEGWRISTRSARRPSSRDPRSSRAPGGDTPRSPRNNSWDSRDR